MDSHLTVQQQKLLANELRQKILRAVQNVPKTAKQVAVELGASVGNAHYHLQRLAEGDLVTVVEDDAEKRYRAHTEVPLVGEDSEGELLRLEDTVWLTIAETGQFVNELRAFFYRWQGEFHEPRGRARPIGVAVHLTRRPTS